MTRRQRVVALVAGLAAALSTWAFEDRAATLVSRTRTVVGEEKLRSLRSLSAVGPYRLVTGDRQVTGEREVSMLFPDKYAKTETRSSLVSDAPAISLVSVFDGTRAWFGPGPGSEHVEMVRSEGAEAAQRLAENLRAESLRYLIAFLAAPVTDVPLSFTYAGEAEAPDGRAEAVDIAGSGGAIARLFVDKEKGHPLMLTYHGVPRRIVTSSFRVQGDPADANGAGQKGAANRPPTPEKTEVRLYLSEYRRVDGLLLPHKISTGTAEGVAEEWTIQYRINPSLDPKRFQPR